MSLTQSKTYNTHLILASMNEISIPKLDNAGTPVNSLSISTPILQFFQMTPHLLIQLVLGLSFPRSPNSLLWLHNTTPTQVKYSLSTCYASALCLASYIHNVYFSQLTKVMMPFLFYREGH